MLTTYFSGVSDCLKRCCGIVFFNFVVNMGTSFYEDIGSVKLVKTEKYRNETELISLYMYSLKKMKAPNSIGNNR